MAGLLDALFQNESGGRNVANTTQGTSSGQAQGYFQITTGTWNDFGGQQYAPTPMQASYEQQAAIASKIPLKRWDESTVAKMRATGKTIDPNRTLGENLAANGESAAKAPRVSGPVEAAGGGSGSETGTAAGGKAVEQLYGPPPTSTVVVAPQPMEAPSTGPVDTNNPWSGLASGLASSVKKDGGMLNGGGQEQAPLPTPEFASALPQAQPLQPVGIDMSPLADLFGTVDIGQAGAMNVDPYGNPIRRRQYG